MTRIVVLRPDVSPPPASRFQLAPRARELPDRVTIGIVDNGKPLAKKLLELLASELRMRIGRTADIALVAKPSSAYSVTDDEANQLAARSHMVITGLGD